VKRDFHDLTRETFDLIVVGGGIIGTGIGRDAAKITVAVLIIL